MACVKLFKLKILKIGSIISLFLCSVFNTVIIYPQVESIVTYDLRTKKIDTIHTTAAGLKTFDYTSSYRGREPGFSLLDTVKPAVTFNSSGFTDFKPAHLFFPLNNYPIRTGVKLFLLRNDSLKQLCSGIVVGKNLILTAWHCACSYDVPPDTAVFRDNLYIIPSYDNGKKNALYGKIKVVKSYIPISDIRWHFIKDIALLKTEEPIGLITGWIGIGFADDDNFYRNRVLHKLSYPGKPDLEDSTRIYNGDTLYYNYGTLDDIEPSWIGYGINGIQGQSGSSLFYTDNKEYYSLGVESFAYHSNHYRITKEVFYAFKDIIEEENSQPQNTYENVLDFDLTYAYPNPFNSTTNIIYTLRNRGVVTLKVYNSLGSEIAELVNGNQEAGKYRVNFNAGNNASGVYYYRLNVNGFSKTGKMVYLK